MPGNKVLIEIQEASKKFGNRIILNKINLSVYQGEILSIIGENGSGKTTLLKMIIGFLQPDSGKILYGLRNVSANQKDLAGEFGFATQENSFYPNLTAEENVRYFGNLYNIDKDTLNYNIKTALSLVKLSDSSDIIARHLSTGMQRRLDIACSLVNNPRILILDEPTEDLDIFLRREMLSLIKRINANGTTIILTSHLMEDVEQVADRVAILYNHTIIKQGPVSMLRSLTKKRTLDEAFSSIIRNA